MYCMLFAQSYTVLLLSIKLHPFLLLFNLYHLADSGDLWLDLKCFAFDL